MQKNETGSFVRFFIAGLLCFAAAYLSEKQLGAIATLPFILVFPGIGYLIYKKPFHLAGFTLLAAFMFKCVYSGDTREIVLFPLFCAVMALVSAYTFKYISEAVTQGKKTGNTVVFPLLFILALTGYIICFGTIFGNLSSNNTNREYLEATYPSENFELGSTYYSLKDRRYVTDFEFTARERYKAQVSADKNGNAPIDGYRDLVRHEILTDGLDHIRRGLSTFAYENSDFALRYDIIDSDDIITADATYSEYADKCCYEIALYYQFNTADEFEEMCRSYADHLSLYDSISFKRIRFYGFDSSDSDDFAYMTDFSFNDKSFDTKAFDDKDYSRYFTAEDTHRYWDLLV